jgi:excisionase family DNA binding protein
MTASSRVTVDEITRDLNLGRVRIYEMLNKNVIPNVRLGRCYLVTRHAYEEWKNTCGLQKAAASVGGMHRAS